MHPSTRLETALSLARETRAAVVGENVLEQLTPILAAQFPRQKAVVVADPRTWLAAGATVQDRLAAARLVAGDPVVLTDVRLCAEMSFVEQVSTALASRSGIPVAVGSGTINDIVKLAAHRLGRPYVSVGTAASMDGYTAFGASITYAGLKQTFPCSAPRAVIADLTVMRQAPPVMLAAGYGDLLAKVVCGADWIVADALGIEAIDAPAWDLVQGGLHEVIDDPARLVRGETAPFAAFVEGLLLGGLAMQWHRSSRPASGAEHQFSHLWDMEHHLHNGVAPAHGFKVGVATHFIAALYEQVLLEPFDRLDVAQACAQWPDRAAVEAQARAELTEAGLGDLGATETLAKYVSKETLARELNRLRATWPQIKERLQRQLLPAAEMRRRLETVGAPSLPESIGLTRARLAASVPRAQLIRRRYTVLDLCRRTALLNRLAERALNRLYY